MQVKVLFVGEGVSYAGFGLGFSGFKIWTGGPQFKGYTGMLNRKAFLGLSFFETPIVDLGDIGQDRETLFRDLHGKVLFVKIEPDIYGGIATVKITVKKQVQGQLVEESIEFIAENCRNLSITTGTIEFMAEALVLPEDEWTPSNTISFI